MTECTCSFRSERNYLFFDPLFYCSIKNDGTQCDPDTCTLWQDHLRIEALEKKFAPRSDERIDKMMKERYEEGERIVRILEPGIIKGVE